jgi:hypothetical protein
VKAEGRKSERLKPRKAEGGKEGGNVPKKPLGGRPYFDPPLRVGPLSDRFSGKASLLTVAPQRNAERREKERLIWEGEVEVGGGMFRV